VFASFNASLAIQILIIASLIAAEIVIFVAHRPTRDLPQYAIVVLFSAFDSNSDLLFILTSVFYSKVLLGFSLTFFLLPSVQFVHIVRGRIKSLMDIEDTWADMLHTWFRFNVSRMRDGNPHFLGKRVFCFDSVRGHGIRCVMFVVSLVLCAAVQVVWSVCWIAVHSVYFAVVFSFGYWLHSCKLHQNNKTFKSWSRWLFNEKVFKRLVQSIPIEEEIDVGTSNKAVIGELVLESIPQTCLVLLNGYLMQELTIVEYVTMAGSALIIVNCLFKYGYWSVWMGVRLRHIPFSGYPEEEHMRHSASKAFFDSYFSDGDESVSRLPSPRSRVATMTSLGHDSSTSQFDEEQAVEHSWDEVEMTKVSTKTAPKKSFSQQSLIVGAKKKRKKTLSTTDAPEVMTIEGRFENEQETPGVESGDKSERVELKGDNDEEGGETMSPLGHDSSVSQFDEEPPVEHSLGEVEATSESTKAAPQESVSQQSLIVGAKKKKKKKKKIIAAESLALNDEDFSSANKAEGGALQREEEEDTTTSPLHLQTTVARVLSISRPNANTSEDEAEAERKARLQREKEGDEETIVATVVSISRSTANSLSLDRDSTASQHDPEAEA
jgi:hypothetical protein